MYIQVPVEVHGSFYIFYSTMGTRGVVIYSACFAFEFILVCSTSTPPTPLPPRSPPAPAGNISGSFVVSLICSPCNKAFSYKSSGFKLWPCHILLSTEIEARAPPALNTFRIIGFSFTSAPEPALVMATEARLLFFLLHWKHIFPLGFLKLLVAAYAARMPHTHVECSA